jgi:hypothetical protein
MPTTTPFNNLITFSRGSHATVTGPNGLIQWAPNNLLTNSEQFDNAAWTKGAGASVVANNQVAPDGSTTADTITFTAGGATEFVRAFASFTVGLTYTVSVYARRVSGTPTFIFDVGNGAAISGAQPITSEWQRFSFTFTFSGANQWVDLEASAAGSIAFWGAQLELGSTATAYNPTTVKNLLGFSEAFDNAAWTKLAASIVTGAQANPVNGLFNAQKFMEDTTNAEHIVRVNIALSTITGTPYGYSVYAKAAGRTQIRVTDNNVVGATFTLTGTGATSNISGGVTASISPLADGWYRCFISVAAASVNGRLALNLVSSGNTTYTGDGNSGVYIYGAQLSDSASLDPYVPTPGAAPSSTAFYGPRFDFDPVTLQPRGLLVEEQRTNSLTYSDQFNDGSWSKNNITVTANSASAPDGTLSADTITTTGVTTDGIFKNFATSAVAYTFSAYLKQGNTTFSELSIIDQGTVANRVRITYATGVLTVVSGTATGTATNVGNGWWRVTITYTFPATGIGDTFAIYPGAAGGGAGDFTYVWGAQLEAGAFATSYIPTVASTVTRSADVATIGGQNFAQWYQQNEGTWAFDFGPFNFAGTIAGVIPYDTAIGAVTNGSRNGRQFAAQNFIGWNVTNKTGTPNGIGPISGTSTLAPTNGSAPAQKLTIFQTVGSMGGVVNSGTVTSGAITTAPTGASDLFYINPMMNGHIRNISFIPVRAADFQAQALSRNTPWNVTLADGTNYNIPTYTARTADGTSYNVPRTVLTAARTQYSPV